MEDNKNNNAEEIVEESVNEEVENAENPTPCDDEQPAETETKTEAELLKEQVDELKDRNLRLAAEYDNYRKRTQKERDSIYPEAVANTLKELLPIVDNFKRAADAETTDENYAKGVQLIYQSFWEKLVSLGVTEIAKCGDQFDPNLHEAVMHIEDEAYGKNEISSVFQQGYKIGDRIIRHAMVQVAN